MIAKAPKSRYADHIKEWEELSASLLPSATEAPQVEIQRAALQKMLEQARDLTTQQSMFQAQKQEVSSQLGTLMKEGKRLASVLKATVKQHYGIRNEKLIQFGIQPFRGRKVKATPPDGSPEPAPNPTPTPAPHPSPSPSASGATPATHAAE
jgi:hypothetical protein